MISRILFLLLALGPVAAALAAPGSSCSFSSTPGMAFGAYDDSSATPTDATTSVVVSCARNGGPTPVVATLQIGVSTGSGLIATRSMKGAGTLNYNLYRDSGRTQVWGQTIGVDTGTISIPVSNNSSANGTFVIYGRIPAQQNVPVGAYSDTVQITVSP